MGICVLVLLLLLSLTCFGHSSNKHMICREAGDVFGDVTNNEVHTRRLIGPKGEQGIMGERGLPGLNGLPGIIDYDRIQEILRLKVEEETLQLRVKADKMEKQIHNLTSQISETQALGMPELNISSQTTTPLTPVVECDEGVIHESKCYWAEVHFTWDTKYAAAEEICTNKESRLADIYGEDHYNKIVDYLRKKIDGPYWINVWTGMKKIHKNNTALLSNGSPAPYTRSHGQRTQWVKATRKRTHVYLGVRSSPGDSQQGMGACSPTECILYGALCQKE